jgi:hypothetical protein
MENSGLLTEHDAQLEIIINKENEFSSGNIFTCNYKVNDNVNFLLYYEITPGDKINIYGKNKYGLNILRKYKFSTSKNIIYDTYIEIKKESYREFLDYLSQAYFTEDYLNKCCVCNGNLGISDNEIKCCDKLDCKKIFNCIVTDNIVVSNFNNIEVFDFIFECFSSSFKHPHYNTALEKNILIMNGVTGIGDMKNIVPENILSNNKKELYDEIGSSIDDIELIGKIGHVVYGILKNILSGNYFSMYKTDYEIVSLASLTKKIPTILNINYSGLTENNFNRKENILFHGSSIHSWYLILKNGLVNLSGTKLMANGAAYGNGIYLSDSLLFASGYSRGTAGYNTVIGVFLLNDDLEKYKKTPSIYVVADCSKLILKSLIIYGPGHERGYITEIEKNIKCQQTTGTTIKLVNKVKTKRLNKEMEDLKKKEYISNINVIDDDTWDVDLRINGKITNISIVFNNYPSIAPSIIIKNNYKKIKTKKIDEKQVIDLDILDPNKWRITIKLSDIIENIIENI